MKIENKELFELFLSFKKVHDIYEKANEEQRGRLLTACAKLFNRGEKMGLDRVWMETLVIGGKDFIDSLYGDGTEVASEYDAQIIFS